MPTSCSWGVFGEAVPFGAEERDMLHARRQVCDPSGRPHGAILVHVINDYQTLPFVSTPHPYRDLLRAPAGLPRGSVLNDLQVVVYGWSFTPTFTSGNVAWPITPDLFRRLYQSREPFWTPLDAEGRRYDVYFSNDFRFVYALGYPSATWLQHLTRLAEAAAVMAVLFLLMLLGAAVYSPFARLASAPLRTVLDEIRTSFYRKLFLFFVLAAIGPVLMFALAFGVYMTAKFRADVESEASTVVTVARRVLEQTSSFGARSGALSDDVMVWVGQVVHQDVNLFEGPELLATSQRDLYASGLLPTRTPAQVYRAIALNRLPSFVGGEWLGPSAYVVAAAPMPTAGRDFVLSVPLASRQREIEREIDELNRGVLVGAVFVILFAAGLGASVASRVSDPGGSPVARDKTDCRGETRRASGRRHRRRAQPPHRRLQHHGRDPQRAAGRTGSLASAPSVGRDGAAGRPRNQEPAYAHSARSRASRSRARRPRTAARRRLRSMRDNDPPPGAAAYGRSRANSRCSLASLRRASAPCHWMTCWRK